MHTGSTVSFRQGACDCHTHVFANTAHYPLSPERTYTPALAEVIHLLQHLNNLGLSRVVIVQPSVYGYDNRAVLDAIAKLGKATARGVAVINVETITDDELDRLATGGICGIRLNLETSGVVNPERAIKLLCTAAKRVKKYKWHIQIHACLALILKIGTALRDLPVPIVLDHYAGTPATTSPWHPDLVKLLSIMQTETIYIKLSAGHLCGIVDGQFSELEPLAKTLISSCPKQLIWGSDWPHPDPSHWPGKSIEEISPFKKINDGSALTMLSQCVPSIEVLEQIMITNPANLYGFENI